MNKNALYQKIFNFSNKEIQITNISHYFFVSHQHPSDLVRQFVALAMRSIEA